MKKNEVFYSYLKVNNIPKNLFPIDLYFMKYRAERERVSKEPDSVENDLKVSSKPNYLNKIKCLS